jgi:hypothetical protein
MKPIRQPLKIIAAWTLSEDEEKIAQRCAKFSRLHVGLRFVPVKSRHENNSELFKKP